jgi:hypothetical protein
LWREQQVLDAVIPEAGKAAIRDSIISGGSVATTAAWAVA